MTDMDSRYNLSTDVRSSIRSSTYPRSIPSLSSAPSPNLNSTNVPESSQTLNPWDDAITFIIVLVVIVVLILILMTLIILRLERSKAAKKSMSARKSPNSLTEHSTVNDRIPTSIKSPYHDRQKNKIHI